MRDSWRVGIKEDDKTDLIIGGIFKITRNPYFLSYIFLFLAYILLVANILVIISSLLAFISIHKMIMKEEEYLEALHGEKYLDYKNNVPRYFLI
jgi:protein-S-isoprenylcysteine O-methyltransferase Ste14